MMLRRIVRCLLGIEPEGAFVETNIEGKDSRDGDQIWLEVGWVFGHCWDREILFSQY